ncbi:MAG: hypothetical protein EX254_03970 [Flavobacteriaceae bacterium]|nr:MAG: hypothetical protein EX254_03970 [Flavobacteriaceae bacterium]
MKLYTSLLTLLFLTGISCKETNQSSSTHNESTDAVNTEVVTKSKSTNRTYLCKINDKDWSYTKASGIVSRHKKTKKRTAIITFTNKLDKGSESVQLSYDGDSYQLESASIQLRLPKKGGGMMTAFYQMFPDMRERYPESDISGTLDLTDPTAASGNAELSKLNVRWEKENLEDPANSVITLTGIKFSDIGYSDSERLFGSKNN